MNEPNANLFPWLRGLFEEPVDRHVLDNGLTAILKPERSAPLASVQVWVKTGSVHEDGRLGCGLSHFLEHLMFKGTRRRDGKSLSEEVQSMGGNMNAYTTFDRTVYYIDLPSENLNAALDILGDMVFESKVAESDVLKEKDVILREIDMTLDDPDQELGQQLFSTAFKQHPYRFPVIGRRDRFVTVTSGDLRSYYRERYVPENMVVVMVGDFSPARAKHMLHRHFGRRPSGNARPLVIPSEPAQLARRDHASYRDVKITRGGLAFKIPGLGHPDLPALDAFASLLGQGKSSLLWERLREEARIVHSVQAGTWTPGEAGLFWVMYAADPGKKEMAEEGILRTIEEAGGNGFGAEKLKKAVRRAVAGEIRVRKTMSGQASRLGVAEVVAGDLDYNRYYFDKLCALQPDHLKDVQGAWLGAERLSTVHVSPLEMRPKRTSRRNSRDRLEDFEMITLPNGARLLLQENHRLPELHFRVACRSGLHEEPSGKRGVTALLSTLMTRDTATHSSSEVAELIDGAGGRFSEFAGNNTFGFSLEVMPDDLDLGYSLVEAALLSPVFRKETFQREKAAAVASIREDLDDVFSYAVKSLRKRFFGPHPFSVEAEGTEATLRRVAVKDVAAHYRRMVTAERLVLALAGDFRRREVSDRLRDLLLRLPSGDPVSGVKSFHLPLKSGDFKERQPREQAIVLEAYPDCGIASEDYFAGEVMDELFSGMSSRLFLRVREENGMAYFVGSSRVLGVNDGMFYLYAGTHPTHTDAVYEEFAEEVSRVRSGNVTEAELRRCHIRLQARKRMSLQTNGSRAMQAVLNALYGMPVNDWRNYDRHIEGVTVDTLRSFAVKYFRPDGRVRLQVTPGMDRKAVSPK